MFIFCICVYTSDAVNIGNNRGKQYFTERYTIKILQNNKSSWSHPKRFSIYIQDWSGTRACWGLGVKVDGKPGKWMKYRLIIIEFKRIIILPHSALSWNLSLVEDLKSLSLQDGATKWHYYQLMSPTKSAAASDAEFFYLKSRQFRTF